MLNYHDFQKLRAILTDVPKLESLTLDNCIFQEQKMSDLDLLDELKYGMERNKNFKNLTLRYLTSNKESLLRTFQSMYSLNKELSILFINGKRDNVKQTTSQSIEVNINEEGLLYSLYDDIDLNFFISSRKQGYNHKLFVFRDWENLIIRLFKVKSRNLILSQLQSFSLERHTPSFKREIAMFIFWV